MQDDQFEWDDDKAARNWREHGVTFEAAREVFRDIFAIEWTDDRHGDTEVRFVTIGMVEGRLLYVCSTGAVRKFGSYRLGWQSPMNGEDTTMKTKHDWSRADTMSEVQIHAAAVADPDAQPLTEERLAKMKRTPRLKIIRRALGLTQEEFAARFQIPLGTLRDWEQGVAEPDTTARAYLRAIAGDAAAVERALNAAPTPR
jgi:putative transcriptional regulator